MQIVSKTMQHLSDRKILVEAEHGFRSGRPCETQLVQLIHDLQENLDGAMGHKQTDLVIMDFAKAFDKRLIITKTCLYNFDPLKPHFYTVKLGFPGVYNIFRISAQNIDCGYSLEPPRRGGSNEYPQSMF